MSMKCGVCQVTLNSSAQFDQHLKGQSHAKKLKQLQQGNQQGEGRGRGRGRAIRGAGGRGRGSSFDQRGGTGRGGRGRGSVNTAWAGQNAAQSGFTFPAGLQGLQGLDPMVINALNMTAAALQSAGLGFGKGPQPNTSGNYQPFGNSQTSGNSSQSVDSSDQPFGAGQNFGGSQTFSYPFGNGQSLGNNDNQAFGNPMLVSNNSSFGNNSSFTGNRQGFGLGNPMFRGNWRALKAMRPKQPPPPPKVKRPPPDLNEPLVMGDNMGVVSVSMEGENQLFCDICCVQLTSADQAFHHYRGAKHLKKARVARLHEVGAVTEDNENPAGGDCYCGYCNITVNSPDQLKVHQEGSKHKKMVEQRKRKSGEPIDSEPCEKKASPSFDSEYTNFVSGGQA